MIDGPDSTATPDPLWEARLRTAARLSVAPLEEITAALDLLGVEQDRASWLLRVLQARLQQPDVTEADRDGVLWWVALVERRATAAHVELEGLMAEIQRRKAAIEHRQAGGTVTS